MFEQEIEWARERVRFYDEDEAPTEDRWRYELWSYVLKQLEERLPSIEQDAVSTALVGVTFPEAERLLEGHDHATQEAA